MDYANYSDLGGSDLEVAVFRSDALAPHEYWKVHSSNRVHQPEIELMQAVLEDGLHCFFTNVQRRTRRERRIFAETEDWFFAPENEGVFTFESICSFLGVDPDCIRRGLTLFKSAYPAPDKTSKQFLRRPLAA